MTERSVTTFDLPAIEAVLEMEHGYVLAFSNRTFAMFFADLGIDIETAFAGSKASRLRDFLRGAEASSAARVLEALLKFRGEREHDPTSVHLKKYAAIVNRLRGVRVARVAAVATDVLSLAYVGELEEKTEQRLTKDDLEGAITTARTMLEAVLLELEVQLVGVRGDHKGDLQKLFKSVAKKLRIDEERQDLDDNFKQVVRGLVQIVNGLAPIRNKMSDGHARERKPAPHHARVIVNAAKTIATFLVESYRFQLEKGLVSKAPTGGAGLT
jgi:hypothetical protein